MLKKIIDKTPNAKCFLLIRVATSVELKSHIHGEFSYHPVTYFTCGEGIAEVGHLELIFISCRYLSFLRKKFIVQGEDNLKGSAHANLERNRQRLERKK